MGYPKQFKKGDNVRVANTAADEVAIKFEGYREVVEESNADVDIAPVTHDNPFPTSPVVDAPGPEQADDAPKADEPKRPGGRK